MKQLDDLEKEIESTFTFTDKKVSDNPTEIVEHLRTLAQYLSRSAQLLADVKYIRDIRQGEELKKLMDPARTKEEKAPTLVKLSLETALARERKAVELADRLNSTIVHQMDAFRSNVSYEKHLKGLDGGA